MRLAYLAIAVVLVALLGPTAASAAMPPTMIGSVAIPQTTFVPPIDGTLTDPAWKNAVSLTLGYDLRDHRPASEATTLYLMADAAFLYVGVDAKQSIPVRATEHTNGVGLDTDDEFQVDLWPNGTSGFMYKFTSTAIGTHYQYSTENNLFEPTWTSAGRIVSGGYTITMKIPLEVMHGTGSAGWRVQFIRYMPATNQQFIWSYGAAQQNFNDVNYSGSLTGLPRLAALRGKPRAGIYALGALASPAAGGSTSRAGLDLSLPLLPGTAFVGSFHPDFSDVEVDQQTISPTAFQRFFNEVRPFFTQGANFYNYPNGTCAVCPGISEFYTPNIPTPRDGYAIEGQRGLFNFGALDAVGASRNDSAQALNYVSPNQKNAIDFQRSSVDEPDLHDVATGFVLSHNNLSDFMEFARYANDSGTNVLDGSRAQRYEAGVQYYTPTLSVFGVLRKVGEYFNPVDGIVQHPDIAGYAFSLLKQYKYSAKAAITEVDVTGTLDRYHDHTGVLDQSDSNLTVTATTRTLFSLGLTTGSSYVRFSPDLFSPVSQPGASLTYDSQSSTPTTIQYGTGRFGPGQLNSWIRSSTIKVGRRALLTVEADDTDQFTDAGPRYTQWLERSSVAYQVGPNESFALGARRIVGAAPELTTPFPYENAWNLSAAFHRKVPHGELYIVYGDAAAFSTVPQLIFKYILYVGADKGT